MLDVEATQTMLCTGIGKDAISSKRLRTSGWGFIVDCDKLSSCSRTTEQLYCRERLFKLLEEVVALQQSIGLFNKLTGAA